MKFLIKLSIFKKYFKIKPQIQVLYYLNSLIPLKIDHVYFLNPTFSSRPLQFFPINFKSS